MKISLTVFAVLDFELSGILLYSVGTTPAIRRARQIRESALEEPEWYKSRSPCHS